MDLSSEVPVAGDARVSCANFAKRFLKKGISMTIFNDFSVGSKRKLHEIVDHLTIVRGNARDVVTTKVVIFGRALYASESWIGNAGRLSADVIRITELGFCSKVDFRTGLARFTGWNKSLYQERRDCHCE